MSLSPEEFTDFRTFLKNAAGIDLGDNKQYLVTTRIRKVLKDYNLQSLAELNRCLRVSSDRLLRQRVVDAMTTNETFWFRDIYPFEYLKTTVFPEFVKNRESRSLRIWCAACSTGQEPYSISISAEEFVRSSFGLNSIALDIHATDLSSAVLEQAKSGVYDKLSISRGMSDQRLRDFFIPLGDHQWQVKPELKQRVRFRAMNLQESFIAMGRFDVLFCRNVLIYFSAELKQDILRRLHAALKSGGYLFLGSSESLGEAGALFRMVHCNPGVAYVAK